MSLFLAVDLDPPTRAQVAAEVDRFRVDYPAKWIRPERLHVTVLFLGGLAREEDGSNTAWLDAACDRVAAASVPFSLHLCGSGRFTTPRAASVLWLGVGGDLERLAALRAAAVEVFAEQAPVEERVRPHIPHLTLARSQQVVALDPVLVTLGGFQSPSFLVTHLTLYESTGVAFRALRSTPLYPG